MRLPRNEIKNTEEDFLCKFDSWATHEKGAWGSVVVKALNY